MGQQNSKIRKRRRRTAYIKRKRAAANTKQNS
jgi:hypothetical protein